MALVTMGGRPCADGDSNLRVELNLLPVLNPTSYDGQEQSYREIRQKKVFFFFYINYACPPLRYDGPMVRGLTPGTSLVESPPVC